MLTSDLMRISLSLTTNWTNKLPKSIHLFNLQAHII